MLSEDLKKQTIKLKKQILEPAYCWHFITPKISDMTYLVHDLVVGNSQGQVHGVHQLAKFEVGGMLSVLPLTLDLTANFSSFNCKWPNWYPSNTSDVIVPFRFVIDLKTTRQVTTLICFEIYNCISQKISPIQLCHSYVHHWTDNSYSCTAASACCQVEADGCVESFCIRSLSEQQRHV